MQRITIKNKNYPDLLKKIKDPPKELYVFGELRVKEQYPLAVVGTRKLTDYGKQVTEYFVRTLARAGMTIISGLALGIDGLAHKTTLEAGGRTIAVLGSGLNRIFPTAHKKLAQDIIDSGGAVISEYAPDTPAFKGNFPARNRIISGLSLGVLVIEAPKKSGALITAKLAIDQKRKVFAVPGRIYDRNSAGTNQLIQQGAIAAAKPEDILHELEIKIGSPTPAAFAIGKINKGQALILSFLSQKPTHVDELTKKTNLQINKLISLLTTMEVNGTVKNLGDGRYIRI